MPVLPKNDLSELFIFGCGSFGQICYMHIKDDCKSDITGFIQDKPESDHFLGKPVFSFNDILRRDNFKFYAAIGYSQLNNVRTLCYKKMKEKGFLPISIIHSSSIISSDVNIGEHVYVMENCVLQTSVCINNNTILWTGCNISHHSKLGLNCFVAQGVNICGYVNIGDNCFIGANAIIHNNITVGNRCVIAAGAVLKKDVPDDSMVTLSGEIIIGNAKERFNRWVKKFS